MSLGWKIRWALRAQKLSLSNFNRPVTLTRSIVLTMPGIRWYGFSTLPPPLTRAAYVRGAIQVGVRRLCLIDVKITFRLSITLFKLHHDSFLSLTLSLSFTMPAKQYCRMQCSNRAPPRQPDQNEDDDQDAISSTKESSEEESDDAETSERDVELVEEAVRLFQASRICFTRTLANLNSDQSQCVAETVDYRCAQCSNVHDHPKAS
jgi:hypothetical protein